MTQQERDQLWPALPFADWKDTCVTLHMWTQIVGKVRLALTPWLNHSWHVTLYVTARGLTTSPIAHHANIFEIDFDSSSTSSSSQQHERAADDRVARWRWRISTTN